MRTPFVFAFALAIFVAGCGGSKSPSTPSDPAAGGSSVTIRGAGYDGGGSAVFTPGNLTVNRGTTVSWENTDSITHSVVSNSNLFRTEIGPGGAFEFKFDNAGAFGYSCVIHAGMGGTITVR